MDEKTSRLYRSRNNRMVAGVIAGFSDRLGVPVKVARLAYVLIALLTGFWACVVLYVVAAIVMDEEPATDIPPAPPVPAAPVPPAG